jgi:hypothetical protein
MSDFEETSESFLKNYTSASALHRAKCVLEIGRLVRELADTIEPAERDCWFKMLREDMGDVQEFLEQEQLSVA